MCPELVPAALSLFLSLFPGHPRPAQGTHTGSPALRAAGSENPASFYATLPGDPRKWGAHESPTHTQVHSHPLLLLQPLVLTRPRTKQSTRVGAHSSGCGGHDQRDLGHTAAHTCAHSRHTHATPSLWPAVASMGGSLSPPFRTSVPSFSHSDPPFPGPQFIRYRVEQHNWGPCPHWLKALACRE